MSAVKAKAIGSVGVLVPFGTCLGGSAPAAREFPSAMKRHGWTAKVKSTLPRQKVSGSWPAMMLLIIAGLLELFIVLSYLIFVM